MNLSEAHGPPPKSDAKDLWTLLKATVSEHPHAAALICAHQPATLYRSRASHNDDLGHKDRLRWTYAELEYHASQLASSLYEKGLRKGMALATLLYNNAEYLLALLAAAKLGCIFVPLNPKVLVDSTTTAHMLKTTEARALIIQNESLAQALDAIITSARLDIKVKIKLDSDQSIPSWLTISELMLTEASHASHLAIENILHSPADPFLVVFTSGTTSLPKACLHTNRSLVVGIYGMFFWSMNDVGPGVINCASMPNNHLMGIWATLVQIISGGCILYPGPAFNANEVLAAITKEGATDILAVPTMLFALFFEVRTGNSPKPSTLKRVGVGGAAVTVELLQQAQEELRIEKVRANYGMSEGSPIRGPFVEDAFCYKRGLNVSCGFVVPGAMIRVCAPDTHDPLPRVIAGELHQGGAGMMSGYIGKDRSEDRYTDEEGQEWFKTGDQAIMEDDGQIVICGRYKDIIIRGGENLSPTVIEGVLNKFPGLEAVVVPALDDVAGEVPIAVVRSSNIDYSVKALKEAVMQTLGSMYVPEAILNLKQLDMGDDFPRTLSGKLQKTTVAARVREYLARSTTNGDMMKTDSKPAVLAIWTKLLGLTEQEVNLELPIQNFVDSITEMRFIDAFRKQTGKALSVEDMVRYPTIQDQIKLADSLPNQSKGPKPSSVKVKRLPMGPPSLGELAVLSGHDDGEEIKKAVEETIEPFGLAWEDVNSVTPGYDHAQLFFKKRRERSWVTRSTSMTEISDIGHVRKALERTLSRAPFTHGFLVQRDKYPQIGASLYVTVRPSREWFDQLITEIPAVDSEQELKTFDLLDYGYSHASLPGPMYRADLVHVRDTNKTVIIMSMNHSAFDAMSHSLFYEDLYKLLADPDAELPYHDDYALWSTATHLLRKSPQAETATSYHQKRLSNLASHTLSLFPPSRAPEWFFGNPNAGWSPSISDMNNPTYTNPTRTSLNKTITLDGLDFTKIQQTHLPCALALRAKQPQLTGPALLKAALALFNTFHTKTDHALYSSLEANRTTLPFVPSSLNQRLDLDLADMPGPMYTRTIDLLHIDPTETVLAFLARVVETQKQLTRYAGAPLREVYDRLEAHATGQGDMMVDVMRRQILNWVPGLGRLVAARGRSSEHLTNIKISLMTDEGFIWVAGMGGSDGSTVYLKAVFDDANVKTEEGALWVEQVGKILLWMTDEKNWYRRVSGFSECLSEETRHNGKNGNGVEEPA
ncbi:hypothetical protein BDV97DRAFT_394251 [Delphinella strobiligena]|nr:hypothetical protein BDV97DRAFT_394251 [Delphinella strobiligena]